MNVIHTRFKCASSIVGHLIQCVRGYAVAKPIPVNWVKPERPSCISKEVSGDLGLEHNIAEDDYIQNFDKSEELKDADELVQKMFSVSFNRRRDLIALQKDRAVSLVQRHRHDRGSMETKVAMLTVEILQLQEHMEKNKRNSTTKVFLKEMIEKRKKWLKKLRVQDYARFEYILERLNLVYHPLPLPEHTLKVTRKGSIRLLLDKYCDDVVSQKLNSYKKELESQQKDFYKEKAEKLEFMRNEEIACGVTPTISEEEIQVAKEKAASFV